MGAIAAKTVLICLDGADWKLLKPFLEIGYMPNLRKLMEEGASGSLVSTPNPMPIPAWASAYTGLWPQNHGLLDGLYRRRGTYDLYMADSARCGAPPFWTLASAAGLRVCVAGMVNTYPPDKVNGIMLCGQGAPCDAADVVYPAKVMEELRSHVGEYRPPLPAYGFDGRRRPGEVIDWVRKSLARRTEFFEYLLKRESWDLFACGFCETSAAHSHLWHLGDPTHPWHSDKAAIPFRDFFREFYGELDRSLGRLLEAAGSGSNVVVASQSGSGPLTHRVYINRWLAQQGYLVFRRSAGTFAKRGVQFAGLGRGRRLSFDDVDWSKTRAYSYGVQSGSIYLNLKGREPEGAVSPGVAQDELVSEIRGKLLEWREPRSGKPIVGHVFRREEFGNSRFEEELHDLFVIPSDHSYFIAGFDEFPSRRWLEPEKCFSGTVRPAGVHVLSGPAFRKGVWSRAEIVDLAPTILKVLNLKPAAMDGKPMTDKLKPREKPPQDTLKPRSRRQQSPNQIELLL